MYVRNTGIPKNLAFLMKQVLVRCSFLTNEEIKAMMNQCSLWIKAWRYREPGVYSRHLLWKQIAELLSGGIIYSYRKCAKYYLPSGCLPIGQNLCDHFISIHDLVFASLQCWKTGNISFIITVELTKREFIVLKQFAQVHVVSTWWCHELAPNLVTSPPVSFYKTYCLWTLS